MRPCPPQQQQKPLRREIELDFIRGIAILMVVDFHMPEPVLLAPFAWLGFPHFGWAGVDIFFVLSGFLVGGLLIKEWRVKSRVDSKLFLVRRVLKIWPQYYFYLLASLLTGHRKLHQLWGNLLNVQNYVGGIAHTWTLAVEEHAYLLLLIILAFAARKRIRMRSLFLFFVVMALCVLTWRTILASRNMDIFSRTDTRIDGILYGVMLAALYHCRPDLFRRIQSWTWLWLGVICLALADFHVRSRTWWAPDVSFACADAMGVALLLLLYKHRATGERPALYRFIAWVGLYSYGIYLWHVSVVDPAQRIARHLSPRVGSAFVAIAAPIMGVGLGVLTTKLIEFPALRLRDKLFPRRIDSAVGLAGEIEKKFQVHGLPESVSAETSL